MLQLSEIVKTELLPAADSVKQCRIELASIERQIEESEAPARELEAEIENIRKAMDRGKALAVSDPIDFVKQGGDLLIAELSAILENRLSYLADLRTDIANLQEPLQITK